ncbi:SDR family oxidoreductase [Xenorhabdus sp. 12]|uniref:SDR family oxidoreductase n=1 Tax=Xenorhabdus santafensis TaxID=2582833 RepID=A0ABU4SBE6_9GAMM|nr:SDR family oxidoreductase [Xenorhabdus sp. 12]MDX7988117.1 SDR family oxidoreductase [Xenorhabdus sp. 12]
MWDYFHEVLKSNGYSHFDILINCAGIAPLATLSETNEDLYREVFSINLDATFFLIQSASPYIRDGGRIINLSSTLTRIAAPTRAIYAASKGAINALTLALAPEYGARNITVNAIAPGVVDTDMNAGWLNDKDARNQAESLSFFNRVGTPNDVASLVSLFEGIPFCSNSATLITALRFYMENTILPITIFTAKFDTNGATIAGKCCLRVVAFLCYSRLCAMLFSSNFHDLKGA